jgi:vesicle coat complex subunit
MSSSTTNRYYSTTNKKGEINELKEALNSTKNDSKIDGLKKTIAFMTIGKDVSSLFQPVIKCLEMNHMEIKKLVYLYIINYSRTKPDDAIMIINCFNKVPQNPKIMKNAFFSGKQDAQNKSSPLIRALAIRTMGCLRVSSFNDYLIDSLKKTLSDSDPYVRKTAVLCVPKFYELTPKLVEEKGLVEIMTKLLKTENNPSVLTNLVISLQEISILSGKKLIVMDQALLKKVLTCVNEAIGTLLDWPF